MAHLCDFIATRRKAAGEAGEMDALRQAFPGTPDMVFYEATTAVDFAEVEDWWQSVEKTIDGEVIRLALAGGGK
jgi:hypothetical protein